MGWLSGLKESFSQRITAVREYVAETVESVKERFSKRDIEERLDSDFSPLAKPDRYDKYTAETVDVSRQALDYEGKGSEFDMVVSELLDIGYKLSDLVDLIDQRGIDPDVLLTMVFSDSEPTSGRMRYSFNSMGDAVEWVADIGASGYFVIVEIAGEIQVWETEE